MFTNKFKDKTTFDNKVDENDRTRPFAIDLRYIGIWLILCQKPIFYFDRRDISTNVEAFVIFLNSSQIDLKNWT